MTSSPSPLANPQATDILVVGAGPAGATTSLFLAKAQIPHTIIDKARFPRGKVDGNVYGRKVVEVLNQIDERYVPELLNRQDQVLGCQSAQIFVPNGNSFRVRFTKPLLPQASGDAQTVSDPLEGMPFFTINRTQFDAFLVSKLDSQYAHPHWETELTAIEKTPQGWSVTLNQGDTPKMLSPKLIIAADGANSKVVQMLGLKRPETRYYDMIQGYFKGVSGFEGDRHIEGHFLPQTSPGFFFMAPLADGTINVGINKPRQLRQQDNTDLLQVLKEAIAQHPTLATRFAQSEVVGELKDWPEVVGTRKRLPLSGDGYLLTGDAAGLCNPLTGFGTGSAMLSGKAAAQQATQALQNGRFERSSLESYDKSVYQQLQTEFAASQTLHQLVQRPWIFNQLAGGPFKQLVKTLIKTPLRGAIEKVRRM
ncbi:MAG: FAD-dependent monooxygenase [Cyanobacteria bacterium P01_F01_bin.150]